MNEKVQLGRGVAHDTTIHAMPGEVLVIHVPDPEQNKIIKVNDIVETRFAKIIAVGAPTGRYREAPFKVGEIAVTRTPTAGVAVTGVYLQNRLVHRLDWHEIVAIAEEHPDE